MGPRPIKAIGILIGIVVHLYTASGSIIALLILLSLAEKNFAAAFLWTFVATMVDYTDGTLARLLRIKSFLPRIEGLLLDAAVDFAVNVFLSVFLLVQANLLPGPVWFWSGVIFISSLYRFSNYEPDISRGFFCGIPPIFTFWAFYIFYFRPSIPVIALIIGVYALLCFIPVGYIHAARFDRWRLGSALLLCAWWLVYLLVTQDIVADKRLWLAASLAYPIYFLGSSWYFFYRLKREVREAPQPGISTDSVI